MQRLAVLPFVFAIMMTGCGSGGNGGAGTSGSGGGAGSAGAAGSGGGAGSAGAAGAGSGGTAGAPAVPSNDGFDVGSGAVAFTAVACGPNAGLNAYGALGTAASGESVSLHLSGTDRPSTGQTYTLTGLAVGMGVGVASITYNSLTIPYYSPTGQLTTAIVGDEQLSIVMDGLTLYNNPNIGPATQTASFSARLTCPKERFSTFTVQSGDTCSMGWAECPVTGPLPYFGIGISGGCPTSKTMSVTFPAGVLPATGDHTLTSTGPVGIAAGHAFIGMFDVSKYYKSQSGVISVNHVGDEFIATFTAIPLEDGDQNTETVSGTAYCRIP